MTRLDLAVDCDVAFGDGAPPNLMVALTLTDEIAACFLENTLELASEPGHFNLGGFAVCDLDHFTQDFEREVVAVSVTVSI